MGKKKPREKGRASGVGGWFARQRIRRASAKLVEESGLFDADYYKKRNPIAQLSGLRPEMHYVTVGFRHDLEVNAEFSLRAYFARYPRARDFVARNDLSALEHYLTLGRNEGMDLPPASEEVIWVIGDGHRRRPDAEIFTEIKAGSSYRYRYGFGFKSGFWSRSDTLLRLARSELSSRTPRLTVSTEPDVSPDVSIVIPIHGQTQYLLNCLDSLSGQVSRYSVEIIIVDDASPDYWQTREIAEIPWVRFARRDVNGGFIDACNYGASLAKGRFILLLNSDVRVARGWLDELIGSFDLFPDAGLVGSKLFFGGGRLQEAGSEYSSDGQGRNVGFRRPAGHPAYSYARQVDYCSGASVAIAADVWRQIGGFDEVYAPSYYEDGDLAFKVRDAGKEVWYQPQSRVVHYGGASHSSAAKSAQMEANRQTFVSKWSAELAEHGSLGRDPKPTLRRLKGRVLMIDSRTPEPDRDSGSYMTVKIIEAIQELGFQVTFLPANFAYDDDSTRALQRRGVECLYRPFISSYEEAFAHCGVIDYIFVFRFENAYSLIPRVRDRGMVSRIIFHTVDLHHVRMQREAELFNDDQLKIRAERVKTRELKCVVHADCTIVHTDVEKQILRQEAPVDNTMTFTYIADLQRSTTEFDDRRNVMFLGGFDHPPNVDGILYFIEEIWPLAVSELGDDARLLIVGASPPPKVLALASDSIVITGWVPHLREHFDSARVFVAPLRFGAGVKGKIVQSFAHGVPVVATSVAAEGFGLTDRNEAMIADQPGTFATAITAVYKDKALWERLQSAGYGIVEDRFSTKGGVELCRQALTIADTTWLQREQQRRDRSLNDFIAAPGSSRFADF